MRRTDRRHRGVRVAAAVLAAATTGACAPGCGAGRSTEQVAADPGTTVAAGDGVAHERVAAADSVAVRFLVEVRWPLVTSAGVVPPRWRLPLRERPLPDTRVLLVDAEGGVLVDTSTDGDGWTAFAPDDVAAADRAVVLAANAGAADVRVVDCPTGRCPMGGLPWAWAASQPSLATGRVVVPVTSAVAGAFSISAEVHEGLRAASALGFADLPPLDLRWRSGSDTACRTSCYAGGRPRRSIYVLSVASDTDEFDRDILRHELGHYLEDAIGAPDAPGGYHDGTPMAPAHAWSEGGCTWLAIALEQDPVYVDTGLTGGGWYDYSVGADWDDAPELSSRLSEDFVAELLWELTVNHGAPVVAWAWREAAFGADRGAAGPDLVDALDRLACSDAALADAIADATLRRGWAWSRPEQCGAATSAPAPGDGDAAHSPITPLRIALARGGEQVRVDVELRAVTRSASMTLLVGAPGEEMVVETMPFEPSMLAARQGRWDLAVEPSLRNEPVSVRVDAELLGGARYHMSATIEPDGVVPFTLPVDDTRVEKLGDDLVVRIAGDSAGP